VITFKPAALISIFAGIVFSIGSFTVLADHDSGASIESRISPDGRSCVEGKSCEAPVVVVKAAPAGPRSGEEIYIAGCGGCHDSGAAGAPKLGDVAAWAPRLDKGMEKLFSNAFYGYKSMPAKGLCKRCDKEEIDSAVIYIADNSK
jgi:cytochrome c5